MNEDARRKHDHPSLPWIRIMVITLAITALVALAVTIARLVPITRRYVTDADTIRVPRDAARVRDILWQPAKKLSDLINTGEDDYEPRLSADSSTLFFVRGKAGRNADIYTATKTPDGWSEPKPLEGVNSPFDDLGPEPAANGAALYFYSDRPGGLGGYDLWVSHRSDRGWQEPINLGPNVNSDYNDYGPALTPDGGVLYFSSNRPGPQDAHRPDPAAWSATLREDLFRRHYDLYLADVTDAGVAPSRPLSALNTPYNEGAPAVSPFGDFLYFSSDRPGGEGGFDLYRSRRLEGKHRPPINLGAPVNTKANELDPGLSLGGYALYFSSDRIAGIQGEVADPLEPFRSSSPETKVRHRRLGPESGGKAPVSPSEGSNRPREDGRGETHRTRAYNLFYTTSREVFTEVERLDRAPIDWAALWRVIGPNLLWALLAMLLLLALLAIMRKSENRRLSLLSKCLLASVIGHVLLMLLFNVWEVTASLAREFQRRGRIQIALASPTVGTDIARQIRGTITSVEAPEPPTMTMDRQPMRVDAYEKPTPAALDVSRTELQHAIAASIGVSAHDVDIEKHQPDEWVPPLPDLTTAQPPKTFEARLPQQPPRISTPETTRSVSLRDVPSETMPRPDVRVAERSAAPTVTHLAPAANDSSMMIPSPTSLSRAVSASESAPPSPIRMESEFAIASLDRPSTPDLKLPAAPVDRPAETPEPSPLVAARAVETRRRTFVPIRPPAQSPQATVTLEPARSIDRIAETRLAAFTRANAVEAVPPPTVQATPATDPDHAAPPLDELSLRTLETAPSKANEPPAPSPSLTLKPDALRRALPPQEPPAFHQEEWANIALPSSSPGHREASLASSRQPQPDDASMSVSAALSEASDMGPSLPDLSAVALPALEQADVEPYRESAPRFPTPHISELRASLSRTAPAAASSASSYRFDVPGRVTPPLQHDAGTDSSINILQEDAPPPELLAEAVTPDPREWSLPESSLPDLGLPMNQQVLENPHAQRVANDPIQAVRGIVTDASTGETLGGASIRLDLPGRSPITARSGSDGTYRLLAPTVPDQFALSASHEGYIPSSANVESARRVGTTLTVDFKLRPTNDRWVVLEPDPEVHHLGDDRFDGRINSRFQRESEGARYGRDFLLTGSQIGPGITRAEVTLLAKGVQRRHRIRINDVVLDQRLDDAPRDGGFGKFVATFDPSILVTGRNSFEIIAHPSKSDIDDFEFVNVRIRLIP